MKIIPKISFTGMETGTTLEFTHTAESSLRLLYICTYDSMKFTTGKENAKNWLWNYFVEYTVTFRFMQHVRANRTNNDKNGGNVWMRNENGLKLEAKNKVVVWQRHLHSYWTKSSLKCQHKFFLLLWLDFSLFEYLISEQALTCSITSKNMQRIKRNSLR